MSVARKAKPKANHCLMPPTMPAGETAIYQQFRRLHCAEKREGHDCSGRVVLDRNGLTLSCPICGDARSVFERAPA